MDAHTQREFFEKVPPGKRVCITDFEVLNAQGLPYFKNPDIELHCSACNGPRFFAVIGDGEFVAARKLVREFIQYHCRNCRSRSKSYAVAATFDKDAGTWVAFKYGEEPPFGPPTPARAITLVGPDRELFLQGRRCENQGLGIGAFVYYRRVVENQKTRIFDEVIRAARHLGTDDAFIAELELAKAEVQFTKATEAIKHAMPQSLLINGANPLRLLHSALSVGVHGLSDAQCLELAQSIRVVLVEFAERLGLAMKDEDELKSAVNKLSKATAKT